MAKSGEIGWVICFHWNIKRVTDDEWNPVVLDKIRVNDGYIIAMASDQWELGDRLDEMVLKVLDFDIHNTSGYDYNVSQN